MATDNDFDDKKTSRVAIGGIVSVVSFAAGNILNLLGKGVKPSQIISFINAWPVVLMALGFCIAYIIVECYKQKNKTIRSRNDAESDKKEIAELKGKVKELEKSLSEVKKENCELALEKGRLEIRTEYQEKEIERLQQNNRGETVKFPYIGKREL